MSELTPRVDDVLDTHAARKGKDYAFRLSCLSRAVTALLSYKILSEERGDAFAVHLMEGALQQLKKLSDHLEIAEGDIDSIVRAAISDCRDFLQKHRKAS